MNDGALNDALEACRRLGFLAIVDDEALQFVVHILDKLLAQMFQIDIAGAHDRCRVPIVDQGQQQVFKRGVFVLSLISQSQRSVKTFFETTGQ
ncbi:200 kDa antigen p200, putative [Tepidicaulis marinus]|uniref:200 kDa antigen p200, putative n=1 Tax=Tepidicaulis marinus TaxID=1333998 RepID=A0A081BEA1_9HYPH|nr:200 kDa antigen p200, putative [Tepidicaulis marinus]